MDVYSINDNRGNLIRQLQLTNLQDFPLVKFLCNVVSGFGGDVGDDVGDEDDTKLTERQEGILNLIKENAHVSANEMSEVLSVTQRTIERDLAAMQKKRVIIREGKVKSGRWVVIKE